MTGGSRTLAALLASCLVVSPVLAEPKAVSEKDKQVASDLVKKAISRSQAGDHSAAIDIYLQAYTIVPNSILLSNIGSEFQQSGKQKEALRYFCMYLEKDPTGTNAPYATTQAKSLQALLGNKHVSDDDVCVQPKHKRPDPEPDPDPDPDPPAKPPKGPKSPPPEAPPETAAHGDPTLRYVGLAFGGAGLIAGGYGVYAGFKARDISNEISNHDPTKPWPNGIQQLQKNGQSYEYRQIGGLLVGAGLIGVGLVLYFRNTGPDEATHDKLENGDKDKVRKDKDDRTVHLTPTSNGLAVYGRF